MKKYYISGLTDPGIIDQLIGSIKPWGDFVKLLHRHKQSTMDYCAFEISDVLKYSVLVSMIPTVDPYIHHMILFQHGIINVTFSSCVNMIYDISGRDFIGQDLMDENGKHAVFKTIVEKKCQKENLVELIFAPGVIADITTKSRNN